jgi:hypothetical protein
MSNRVARCTRVVRELTGTLQPMYWEVLARELERLDQALAKLLVHPRLRWPVVFRPSESATGATFLYAEQLAKAISAKARERLTLADMGLRTETTGWVACGWAKRDVERLRLVITAFLKDRPRGASAGDPRSSQYWEQHFRGGRSQASTNGHTPERALMEKFFTAGYRALAKQFHPDKGGRTEDMQALNEFVARLRKQYL